jgi:uncharacterized protein (TIGR00269 family)
MKCRRCKALAAVALPSHNTAFCPECFLGYFQGQIETAVRRHALLARDDRVLVAVSGGKDSLALTLELKRLGYDISALHVDLGIPDSSQPARQTVEAFCERHGIPLRVVALAEHGLAMPEVKRRVRRPICSVCGKVKRHWFNRAAREQGFTVLATGHNLDDEVARLFANTLRWDASYLSDQGPLLPAEQGFARKVKPLYRLSEFETACYCFLRGIEPHLAACPFSTRASFTGHKRLWGELEHTSPGSKLSFYEGFLERGRPAFAAVEEKTGAALSPCPECGFPTSGEICGVCRLVRLMRGEPKGGR